MWNEEDDDEEEDVEWDDEGYSDEDPNLLDDAGSIISGMEEMEPDDGMAWDDAAVRQQQQQKQQQHGPRFPPPAARNATLGALEARRLLQERADAEFEDSATGTRGREFLDASTLRHILGLRARGTPAREIEARLRLKPGVVARLGTQGVVVPLAG